MARACRYRAFVGKTLLDRVYAMMDRLELWLRLDRLEDRRDLSRARAVYIIAGSMILVQSANLVSMTITYGGIYLDHYISVAACLVLVSAMSALRFSQSFHWMAAFLTALLLACVITSAINVSRGIHTSLLPFLLVGPILNAFISGRRAVVTYTFFATAAIWFLYSQSEASTLFNGADREVLATVAYQRAFQAQIILLMIGTVSFLVTAKLDETTTQLEKLIEEAQHSERRKTDFFANMSHELRTPLNGVIGMSGLLMRTELDPTQRHYAEIVNNCSSSLVDLIGGVLDLSKMDQEKFVLAQEKLNLRTLLEALQALHLPNATAKGVGLALDWGSDVPEVVVGDSKRLRQIAHNLIGNALKFTDAGEVRISVRSDWRGDTHRHAIFVSDTGCGIAPEAQARVFERFEQADSRRNGTGLGLAISREFVKAMGGQLALHSEPGRGSVFKYVLPLKVAHKGSRQDVA